jgi:hypothetical protein
MPGIFDDEQGRVADGSWGPHPTAPPAPNPGGNSLPPNASIIPFQTLTGEALTDGGAWSNQPIATQGPD